MTRGEDFMKRLRANLLRWLITWGVSVAGFVACVDVRTLLAQPEQDGTPDPWLHVTPAAARARASHGAHPCSRKAGTVALPCERSRL